MIEIRETQDYPGVKRLCDATLDQLTNLTPEAIEQNKPTIKWVERWNTTGYLRVAVLDGKIIASFYLAPPPTKRPRVVQLEALGTDPNIPYELQREAAWKLIRTAIDDYMKVGTKTATGMGWVESAAHSICTDLGLPQTEGAVDPLTRKPIQYNIEVPLTLVDELLRKQGI